MRRVNGLCVALSVLIVTCVTVTSLATPISIDNTYLLFGSGITYYNGASQQFGFSSNVASAKIQSAASAPGVYDYQILNGAFTFNPDSLVLDHSAGGIALGDFAGGGTVQLTGDIKRLSDGVIIYSGQTLLTATMTIPDSATWLLEEEGGYMVGSMFFNPTGGVLATGDELNIGEFRLAFKARPMVNPSNFAASQTCMTQGIEIVAVPEPATLVVLGLGGLMLVRRRA